MDKFVANMPLNLCKIHSVYATGVPSDIQASAAGAATTTFCRRSGPVQPFKLSVPTF